MKKLALIIILICSSRIYAQIICEGQQVVPIETFNHCNSDPWVLVFEDSFDGITLDLSTWGIQGWAQGALYGNGGATQEYNTLDNAIVSNGTLKIVAKKETVQRRAVSWLPDNEILQDGLPNLRTYNYTSSNIWTKSTFNYGKFEARIKLAKGKGFWPAFWTFGGDPWNEIDVFEFWNENDIWGNYDASKLSKVHHMTVHYDYDNDGNTNMCMTDYNGVDFSQDFHTFAVIWEKNKIEWLVDGVIKRTDYRYYTILGQAVGCTINAWGQYILNKIYTRDPMAIILNFAIQSGSNSPDNSTSFPSQMEIDYVRYYQRNPCQDVNITDASQYPLDNQVFNVIVGEDVNINCNYTIQSGQQLDIIAKNSISLGSGFDAEMGSTFSSRIEPTVCGSTLKSDNIDNNQDTLVAKQNFETQITDKTVSNEDIKIFPNPNEGSFVLDFGSKDYKNFNVVITDIDGKLISSMKELNSSTVSINISGNAKGVYVLYLLNNQDKSITTHKIILQ